MLATAASATVLGVEGHPIRVEVHHGPGFPAFSIVGLPDTACREARDRVRAAIHSAGESFPSKKTTVNLAPTGLRKMGAGLDLAVAIAVLAANDVFPADRLEGLGFIGELGLDGTVRPVPGLVPLVDAISAPAVVVAHAAARDARLVGRHDVHPVATLAEVVAVLAHGEAWPDPRPEPPAPPPPTVPDLADVRGQPVARLAVEIAAAGMHHLLLVGPPGAGKTMLARRLPGLLPDLPATHAVEVTRIHSAAGLARPPGGLVDRPPFRAPHHAASTVSLIGGGSGWMRPGEASCASRGVLFLDELGEFAAQALEGLRQPLEEGEIRVARAKASVTFPAHFLLVAAMNPCPCGQPAGPASCRCTDAARARYVRRLSGPLLDRFDLRVEVQSPATDDLLAGAPGETTVTVAARVAAARRRAAARGVEANSRLYPDQAEHMAPFGPEALRLVRHALATGSLSARGLHRVRTVALTVSDLRGVDPPLGASEVGVALALRQRPRTVGADTALAGR